MVFVLSATWVACQLEFPVTITWLSHAFHLSTCPPERDITRCCDWLSVNCTGNNCPVPAKKPYPWWNTGNHTILHSSAPQRRVTNLYVPLSQPLSSPSPSSMYPPLSLPLPLIPHPSLPEPISQGYHVAVVDQKEVIIRFQTAYHFVELLSPRSSCYAQFMATVQFFHLVCVLFSTPNNIVWLVCVSW